MFPSLKRTVPLFSLASAGALLLLAAGRPAAAQEAHLVLHSQPGDFIGQGHDFDITYTPANVGSNNFFATVLPSKSGQPDFVRFEFYKISSAPFTISDSVGLDFSSQGLGVPLTPGTYTDAQRAGFADPGHPGLDVSFDGRGSNTLTGAFTITDFTYTSTPRNTFVINTFDATFEQHSEGLTPALFGTFSYNSAPVPEASTTASFGLLLALGLGGLAVAKKRKKTA